MTKRTVPETSKEAYKQLSHQQVSTHHSKILFAMRLLNTPASMEVIAEKAGMTYEQCHKRFKELEIETLIFKNGKGKTKSGRACYLYSLVQQTKKIEERNLLQTELF